jgi:hypothetical protein
MTDRTRILNWKSEWRNMKDFERSGLAFIWKRQIREEQQNVSYDVERSKRYWDTTDVLVKASFFWEVMQRMSVVVYRRFGRAFQLHYQEPSSPKIRAKTPTKRRRRQSQISRVFGAAQDCLMLYLNLKVVWKGGGMYGGKRENVGSMENQMKYSMVFLSKRRIRR